MTAFFKISVVCDSMDMKNGYAFRFHEAQSNLGLKVNLKTLKKTDTEISLASEKISQLAILPYATLNYSKDNNKMSVHVSDKHVAMGIILAKHLFCKMHHQ